MENYKRYKENNPHKTDAQIIESLVWELKDKVQTIHRLLAENEALRIQGVSCCVCETPTPERIHGIIKACTTCKKAIKQ